jgi:hypothetical protein
LGISDPPDQRAYVVSPEQGIDGIDLNNGRIVWHSSRPGSPLIAYHGQLAAFVPEPSVPNAFHVAVFHPPQIEPVLASETVALTPWISAGSRNPDEFSYRVHIRQNSLTIMWQAHSRYKGGAPPPPGIKKDSARMETGEVQVDLESGTASLHRARLKALRRPETVSGGLQALSYKQHHRFRSEPWKTGDTLSCLLKSGGPGAGRISLKRFSISIPDQLQETELHFNPDQIPIVSADGRYVLFRESDLTMKSPQGESRYEIIGAQDANSVGGFSERGALQDLSVSGIYVYYLITARGPQGPNHGGGRFIRARDLTTESLLWELSVPEVKRPPPKLRL